MARPAASMSNPSRKDAGSVSRCSTVQLDPPSSVRRILEAAPGPAHMTQAGLIPVAYTKGTDFKPASRPPVEEITYLDTYKNPIA